MKKMLIVSAISLSLIGTSSAFALDKLDTLKTLRGSEVRFSLGSDYTNATLSVSGPNGYYAKTFVKTGSPSLDLIKTGGTGDGVYTYELTVMTSKTQLNKNPLDNGRGGVDETVTPVGVTTSGVFHVKNGAISQSANRVEKR